MSFEAAASSLIGSFEFDRRAYSSSLEPEVAPNGGDIHLLPDVATTKEFGTAHLLPGGTEKTTSDDAPPPASDLVKKRFAASSL